MPSWLDYCFEYETVAVRSINKHNNTACLNLLGDCGAYSGRCAITKKNQLHGRSILLSRGGHRPPLSLSGEP